MKFRRFGPATFLVVALSLINTASAATTAAPVTSGQDVTVTEGVTFAPNVSSPNVTVESTTLPPLNTTQAPTTTLRPLVFPPWYMQPLLLILVAAGVVVVFLVICTFICKACLASACPTAARKCDQYCEYECCECECLGVICGKCAKCCCPEEKKKKRRRRKKKNNGENAGDGQWWAYYPGIGWAPAPSNMAADPGNVPSAAPPGGWDAGYDYGAQEWGQGGPGLVPPTMGKSMFQPPDADWDPSYNYNRMEESRNNYH